MFALMAWVLGTLVFGVRAAEKPAAVIEKGLPTQPGNSLLASAEGLSVFSRGGTMKFGHFVTTLKEDKPGLVAWDDMVYDGWRLPSGNFLYSSHRYVRELTPDGKIKWEFRLSAPSELKTCVPLPNGDVMTVDAERMELVQVTDQGRREAKRISVPTKKDASPHTRYNLLRRTPTGTFLLALRHEKVFIEIDESGTELWRQAVPDLPVVAERLANGNTLMSWSGGILEVAMNHAVVWELRAADITEFPVILFGGFHRFTNGNTLIANSDWHYKKPGENRVQVFEITREKQVVWKLTTDAFIGQKPGSLEPTSGLIEHRIIGLQWLGSEPTSAGGSSGEGAKTNFYKPVELESGSPVANPAVPLKVSIQEWESVYRARLAWWSLRPLSIRPPPRVQRASWPRNNVDTFILAALEAKGLHPSIEADRRTHARRLSFVLTGLPPPPEDVERFAARTSPGAYEELVESLLASPHFGERWARHWMDVVHYSDTHGYEWDVPAKNAWMYRDYLVRAFNSDVPFRRLVLEQIAGDLIEPRVDGRTGLNESILGPMAMRLGERRHGDNADAEGITQEAIGNIIDTMGKGFIATTVGCAQCHDHKLDAVAQLDYYGLAGLLMSSRWGVRSADADDPNPPVIEELRDLKRSIRREVAQQWRAAKGSLTEKIGMMPVDDPVKPAATKMPAEGKSPPKANFPDSVAAMWRQLSRAAQNGASLGAAWTQLAEEFEPERRKRMAGNQTNLQLLADFTLRELPPGWQVDGLGMKYGLVRDGEMVIADEGDAALSQILPAGRWSQVWSARLAGAVRSPLFDGKLPTTLSVGYAGGRHSAQSIIVDNSFHGERMKFLDQSTPGWLSLTAGNFATLAGGVDQATRRVYLEVVTKSLNNNFPPRAAFGGLKESDTADPRSWFGVTRIYQHTEGRVPMDDLTRFVRLFSNVAPPRTREELAGRFADLILGAIERWCLDTCDSEDVRLLNEALIAKWLPNESKATPALSMWVARYRETEKRLHLDRVIGSVADWNEGRDERIGVRGSYTKLGEEVPRGNIRFLGGPVSRAAPQSSGRLEFARNLASDQNPLTARVFVNRVWHYLFGAGLVRTVDDFGHLGEMPSHPELLDWLAQRFIDDGWSVKKLVKLLVTSATWRQSSLARNPPVRVDPENRLWHHLPMRRLEAEAIRDSMLTVAGRLDASLYGPPVAPFRSAQDTVKRLLSGPLDGDGRRSLYLMMTLMDPPRFLALFNQPIPKQTIGRRDATNVPDQALALLNDPFVIAMAKQWSERELKNQAQSPEQRVQRMFFAALARLPEAAEIARLVKLAHQSGELHGVDGGALLSCQAVWQDVAHAMFNLKEFIYVP